MRHPERVSHHSVGKAEFAGKPSLAAHPVRRDFLEQTEEIIEFLRQWKSKIFLPRIMASAGIFLDQWDIYNELVRVRSLNLGSKYIYTLNALVRIMQENLANMYACLDIKLDEKTISDYLKRSDKFVDIYRSVLEGNEFVKTKNPGFGFGQITKNIETYLGIGELNLYRLYGMRAHTNSSSVIGRFEEFEKNEMSTFLNSKADEYFSKSVNLLSLKFRDTKGEIKDMIDYSNTRENTKSGA